MCGFYPDREVVNTLTERMTEIVLGKTPFVLITQDHNGNVRLMGTSEGMILSLWGRSANIVDGIAMGDVGELPVASLDAAVELVEDED